MLDVLVVGGNGLIGGHLARRLNAVATTRRGVPLPGVPHTLHFDLRGEQALPPARLTYFCAAINTFAAVDADPVAAIDTNLVGVMIAASRQVLCGGRVVLLSSAAAERHLTRAYGVVSKLAEDQILLFGNRAAVFRFGPVERPDRNTYPDGPYHPISIPALLDIITAPFEPGLHIVHRAVPLPPYQPLYSGTDDPWHSID